jgi:hypothetical protein
MTCEYQERGTSQRPLLGRQFNKADPSNISKGVGHFLGLYCSCNFGKGVSLSQSRLHQANKDPFCRVDEGSEWSFQ